MRRHFSTFLLLTVLVGYSLSTVAEAQRTRRHRPVIKAAVTVSAARVAPPALTPEQQRRQDAFLTVWQTIDLSYFDKTFGGLDWDRIKDEFQPRVLSAKSDAEVHKLLAEMVNRLGKSHFAIIPPEYVSSLRKARAEARRRERELAGGKTGTGTEEEDDNGDVDPLQDTVTKTYGIGIDLKLLDGRFVITRVDEESSAAAADIKPGYILDRINGVSLTELVDRIVTSFPDIHNIRRHLPPQIVDGILNGEKDTSVQLTCLDENDQPHELQVPRMALKGDSVSLGGSLPLQLFQYRSQPIGSDIGYVKFNIFAMAVVGRFCESLAEFKDRKGIIVDLRGNVGGILGTILGITGMVSDQPTSIGTSRYRTDSETLVAQPKKKRFNGRLIFLVDGDSLSAAEIIAASMQDHRRAIIVGERTAGEALPSVSKALATGAVLVYPIANFITPNGRSIEGAGVEPDYTVPLDRRSLLGGVDTQLEKAVSLIRSGALPEPVSAAVPPPPPPPPAKRANQPRDKGTSVKGPPPPRLAASPPPPPVPHKDDAAVRVIEDFVAKVGGRNAFSAIRTYEASGRGIVTFRGVNTDVEMRAARQAPDKFTLSMSSPAMGESREIYNGSKFTLQTDYGVDFQTEAIPDLGRMQLFSVVFDLMDPAAFPSLNFEGTVELDGRKVNAINARTAQGLAFGLIFDDETKLLVRYAPPGIVGELGDYRKVGNVMLPFKLYMDPLMHIQLDKVDLNTEIDPASFERKEKCFDKEQ